MCGTKVKFGGRGAIQPISKDKGQIFSKALLPLILCNKAIVKTVTIAA